MKFGVLFASSQHPPWSHHYINYHRLKALLYTLFENEDPGTNDGLLASPQRASLSAPYYGSTKEHDVLNPSVSGVFIDDPASPLHHSVLAAADAESLPLLHTQSTPMQRCMTSRDFQNELNAEIQKAVLFIIQTMGELASTLNELMSHQKMLADKMHPLLDLQCIEDGQKNLVEERGKEIFDLRMELLVRIGSKLLLLLEFVELNVEAVTKIVKKHDKMFARWEQSKNQQRRQRSLSMSISSSHQEQFERYERLRRQYLPRFARFSSDPNIRCLFLLAADAGDCFCGTAGSTDTGATRNKESDGNFGGWDVMQWNLEKSLRELFEWNESLKSQLSTTKEGEPGVMETAVLLKSRSKSMSASQSHGNLLPTKRRPRSGSRSSFLGLDALASMANLASRDDTTPSKVQGRSFFEPCLYRIQYTRRRLGQTTDRYSRMVYAHEMLHIIDDKHLKGEDEKYLLQMSKEKEMEGTDEETQWIEEEVVSVSALSKFLNLMSSGLYMCNYNIVAPTSGLYAKLLGFDPANAGIIIGMTPLAVIGSSVVYSWWSSYSYKRALLFASFCCIIGNTVYALALPCDSLPMVLFGRMLIGFGSARVINRRYIADYYSLETRTAGMASFVSASAFGMAVGPALAASFSLIAPHGQVMDRPSLSASWTVETVPGWFMAAMWMIYLVLNFFYFEEPDRSKPQTEVPASIELEKAGEQSPLTTVAQHNSLPVIIQNIPRRWSCCNTPVLLSLLVLVLLKSILEGLTSSTPTVGRYYFGWNSHASGIYLAFISSLVLPVNYLVANVSRRYDDREMILGILGVMLAGILGFLVYSHDGIAYSETRFICSGFIIFCSCNAIEAPTMGLLSKTIPKSMASGILNAGLLATEAGTIGRVVGDFYFSAAAFKGFDRVVNLTFEPMGVMVVLSIILTVVHYRQLQPRYEDEEDED